MSEGRHLWSIVDSSIRFMVDSSIHFKFVPTKSIPLLTMIQLGSGAWDAEPKVCKKITIPVNCGTGHGIGADMSMNHGAKTKRFQSFSMHHLPLAGLFF